MPLRLRFLTLSTLPMPRLSGPDLHCQAVAHAAISTACLASALRRRFLASLSTASRSSSLHSVRVRALTLRTARSRLRVCLRLWRLEIEDVDSLLANMATLQTAYSEHQNKMAVRVFRLQQWTKAALIDIYAGIEQSEKWNEEFSTNTESVLAEIIRKKEWGQHRIIEKLALSLRESEQDKQVKMDKFGAAIRTLQTEKKEMRAAMNETKGNAKSLENEKLQLKQANVLLSAKFKQQITLTKSLEIQNLQLKQAHDVLADKLKLVNSQNHVIHFSLECVVCMERTATTIFTPCGHRLCVLCSDKFTTCPHCRAKIQAKFPTKSKVVPPQPSAAAAGRKHQIF
jgi:Zinc finger, C3HC4 type (RING finger)